MGNAKLVIRLARRRLPNDPEGIFPLGGYKDVWSISEQGEQSIAGNLRPNQGALNTPKNFLRISYKGQTVMDFEPNRGKVNLRLAFRNLGNTQLSGYGLNWFTIKKPSRQAVFQLYESGYSYQTGGLKQAAAIGERGFSIKAVNHQVITDPQPHPDVDKNIVGPEKFYTITMAPKNLNFKEPGSGKGTFKKYKKPGLCTGWVDFGDHFDLRRFFDLAFERRSNQLFGDNVPSTGITRVPEKTRTNALPLMGQLLLPEGKGPFPTVGILHGGQRIQVDSAEDYNYLSSILASWGYAVVVISYDYLIEAQTALSLVALEQKTSIKGRTLRNIPPRAILFLELLKTLRSMAQKEDFLRGKLDFNNIMLAGHSLGGQAVNIANFYNRQATVYRGPNSIPMKLDGSGPLNLGPYNFGIRSQYEMAAQNDFIPFDQFAQSEVKTRPDNNTDLMIISGSKDEDVEHFIGYQNFETMTVDQFKVMVWIKTANHSGFNGNLEDPRKPYGPIFSTDWLRTINRFCCLVMADLTLARRNTYQTLFREAPEKQLNNWFDTQVEFITQYRGPKDRLLLDLERSDGKIGLKGISGKVEVDYDSSSTGNLVKRVKFVHGPESNSEFYHHFGNLLTSALEIGWIYPHIEVSLKFDNPVPLQNWQTLFFDAAQAPINLAEISDEKYNGASKPHNESFQNQDFRIKLVGNQGQTGFSVSQFASILWPDDHDLLRDNNKVTVVPQSVRVPLETLYRSGWKSTHLEEIVFSFNLRQTGLVYLSNVGYEVK